MIPCILSDSQLLNVSACRAWWLRRLHPAGPHCPQCGVAVTGRRSESWANDMRLHCAYCGKWFGNRTGTELEDCKSSWQTMTHMLLLLSARVPVIDVAQATRLSENTVRRWRSRLGVVV